jgi:hypothetical protein
MGLHEMTWIVRSGEAVHAPNNGPVWQCVALTCISADARMERRSSLLDCCDKYYVYCVDMGLHESCVVRFCVLTLDCRMRHSD